MKTEGEETRDSESGVQPLLKPKFADIAELLANDGPLHNGEAKSQRAASDNAKLYTRIEKEFHGNKDAAKAVRRLIKMDTAHRDDFLRTFEGLLDHLELWPERDLVDQAGGGNVILSGGDRGRPVAVEQLAGRDFQPDAGGGDASDDDEAGDDDDSTPGDNDDKQDGGGSPFKSALDASRGHLSGGGDPEPAKPKPARKPRAPKAGAAPGAVVH